MRKVMIFVALLTLFSGLVYGNEVKVVVFPDGYVKVTVEMNVTKDENVSISLPVYEFLNLSVTLNGEKIPFILGEENITVYSSNAGLLRVTYITPDLTDKHGKVWKVLLPFNYTKDVTLPEGAVIVGLSGIPLEIRGNSVVMPRGEQYIEYVVPPMFYNNQVKRGFGVQYSLFVVSFILGLVFGLYGGRIKVMLSRGVSLDDLVERYDLNKEEQDVLAYIAEHGGRVRQADIRNDLGIPRTTTWRILKRLEKMNLIKLEKVNNETYAILKVKIKSR
ncbi:helix-turn-helix transcriptional regulator [Pyrococcus abyssi]|uniref:HTH marR-type domain-containing protein n=1 Tax=Pyrococcus abyssi (strain GE5 / Orsay) TaxID=272844 RepID=Q9UZ89_PYRAB|nr:MarR family transcriptional regulator [Pyrococcus abyssi]CAB50170.1 Hypothetical protein PAB1544 [Pyrococcus abyssi GE5]CCE70702.1 TPA: hypothetical protein PAB1544 [Pyrococcus abyssi GE5]